MATRDNVTHIQTLEMLQNIAKGPIFRRTAIARPLSNATEIFDTDSESDSDSDSDKEFDGFSRMSAGSLVADSVTTASTPRDAPTPDNLSSYHFHIDERPVMGPNGPHLFRSSMSSEDLNTSLEVDLVLEKTPTVPMFDRALLDPKRKDTPLPAYDTFPEHNPEYVPQTEQRAANAPVSMINEAQVKSWSPPDVVRWMQGAGFDDSVIEKFLANDISGSILLDLQPEDLKELDIRSFGKRRHLMTSIQNLRNSFMIPHTERQPSVVSTASSRDQVSDCQSSSDSASMVTKDGDKNKKHRKRHHRAHKKEHVPTADDTASIVAIEQILPKPHHCSKGEDCRKWQKQQRKIARLAQDLPIDINAATRLIVEPYYEYQPPHTAKSLPNMDGMPTPSIVASSDILGSDNGPCFRLSEMELNKLRQRDPQESVRQYLNFQHLGKLQPVGEVHSPGRDLASPGVDSPDSIRTNASLSDHLRTLPKLTIPANHQEMVPGMSAGSISAQRTVTPSVLRKPHNFTSASIDATLHNAHQQQYTYANGLSSAEFASPSDFYRSHELYHQTSPSSEVDLPLTAIPFCPIERVICQSVPPDMRFGHDLHVVPDPIQRSSSTKIENHRRYPSVVGPTPQVLDRVDEVVKPIDSLEDLNGSLKGPNHSGWMKKRKTTRMLRHEWEDHHFTLNGTQLAMYEDEEATRRDSKALEYIDVDDYAVACSSLASSSKLTAAFKKTVLKRKEMPQNEAAFAFSLIPAPNGNSSVPEKKNIFASNGKSHHFAVKTRNERIDWMRELMLAKALKRGKDGGDSIHVNGNMF